MSKLINLGDLKANDIFYLINWEGSHISNIDICTVKDVLEIKIGRILHFTKNDDSEEFVHGVTIEFKEYNDQVATSYQCGEICSDKDVLYEILENDKEEFLYNYKQMISMLEQ